MNDDRDVGGRIKKFLVLTSSIFAVTIVTALLGRLSPDTLALIIGVFIGGAIVGTPTVLVASIVVAYFRDRQAMQSPRQQYLPQQQYTYPQQYLPPQAAYHVPPPQARQERDWDVIGEG